ncbi:hypothetical protein E2562_025926 [Oryza meyeriana var. granulata]|uniref:Uncharacterized protein n=1 Tax=Oryza meyeriana var. granulata TaxID=110450 RepID=A0A6G1EYR4_9ORYZ|nr:hypothetical protein E2562_025926 [Oryza meyeriana var. granulata]
MCYFISSTDPPRLDNSDRAYQHHRSGRGPEEVYPAYANGQDLFKMEDVNMDLAVRGMAPRVRF